MRKTTKGHGAVGAVLTAAGVAGIMLLLAGCLLLGYFGGETDVFVTGFVLVYVLGLLTVAVGVTAALIRRIREIRGGEEDEAKKY